MKCLDCSSQMISYDGMIDLCSHCLIVHDGSKNWFKYFSLEDKFYFLRIYKSVGTAFPICHSLYFKAQENLEKCWDYNCRCKICFYPPVIDDKKTDKFSTIIKHLKLLNFQ